MLQYTRCLQPYSSVDDLVRDLCLVLPAPAEQWRLVADPVVGEINGLPHFRGRTLATNGIMVLLRNEVGKIAFGHLDWFIPDMTEANVALSDLWSDAKHVPAGIRSRRETRTLEFYAQF